MTMIIITITILELKRTTNTAAGNTELVEKKKKKKAEKVFEKVEKKQKKKGEQKKKETKNTAVKEAPTSIANAVHTLGW